MLLMSLFAPAVTTTTYLKEQIESGVPWSQAVTVSDETFVLLVLLNFWNVWAQEELKITQPDRPKDKAVWSTKGHGKYWSKFAGWDSRGIDRYVELLTAVEKNRSDVILNTSFDEEMRKQVITTLLLKRKTALEKEASARTSANNAPPPSKLKRLMTNLD